MSPLHLQAMYGNIKAYASLLYVLYDVMVNYVCLAGLRPQHNSRIRITREMYCM